MRAAHELHNSPFTIHDFLIPMPPIIRIQNLHYTYESASQQPVHALTGIDLEIEQGEYVAILGHNGSGKSTLARHLNALLLPGEGEVWVKAWNTKDRAATPEIRRTVGMVFQHPDNQIVATIVEEDVAFGPENLGLPRPEIKQRVDWSLEQVNMNPYRLRAPHLLSGGQKQRVCIAGVLAMHPEVLVLDEATAMLDPLGRQEVLDVVRRLNQEQGVTVVAATHFMREAVDADRIVILAEGRVAMQGPPRVVFQQVETLRELHLDVPRVSRLAIELHRRFPAFPPNLLTAAEIVAEVKKWRGQEEEQLSIVNGQWAMVNEEAPAAAHREETRAENNEAPGDSSPLVDVRHLAHYYMRGTPLEVKGISDISLSVRCGEIVGILGHTGSGKSTAIQHLNGLMRPHEGTVIILGQDMADPATDVRSIRRRVGLLFQSPESQLFAQYVGDDVAFGPRKLKLTHEEVRVRVRTAMEAVGLGFEEFKDRHTFGLSGGQMRRVALAGVLALEPEVLVLDEPTAGLDPQAQRQLMAHIVALHERDITLVMISHNMEELAELCDHLFVIADGRTVRSGTPGEIFSRAAELRQLGLDVPGVTVVADELIRAGLLPEGTTVYTTEQAVEVIGGLLGGYGGDTKVNSE